MENKISFTKQNYIIMVAGLLVVILGFALMSGGGSENPEEWNPDVFSGRRITLAPIMVILGYVIVVIGIMKKNKSVKINDNNKEEIELDLDS